MVFTHIYEVDFLRPPFAFEAAGRGHKGTPCQSSFGRERYIYVFVGRIIKFFCFNRNTGFKTRQEERGSRSYHYFIGYVYFDRLCFGCLVETDVELCFTGVVVADVEFYFVVLTSGCVGYGCRFESRFDPILFFQVGLNRDFPGFYVGCSRLGFRKFDVFSSGRVNGGRIVGKVFFESVGILDGYFYISQCTIDFYRTIFPVTHGYRGFSEIERLFESFCIDISVEGTHRIGSDRYFGSRVEIGQTIPCPRKTTVGRD